MKRLAATLLATLALAAHADGLEALESFVKTARSGRADFTQIVTAPARAGEAARSKTSTGTFEFARPNRFRFDYRKPFVQTIVADGQTLWLHDVDLNQVTARKQAQVLGATPAAIVAAAPDLASLQRDFTLQAVPDRDGLQWVQATPKSRDGQLNGVKVGFRGNELAVLEILDSFGQLSVMKFDRLQVNTSLAADTFQFRPPPGADVVRQ
ncbi:MULTISPECIES: outer membrane lipoprotein chaperone LolA [Ramlibacter]|jgi:outer membrane lipoprotein carrier protein|uniref:Outer-membrane lipoprotein carrier protein n=1 Tax=Ramlibacter pinisoli TaxID=2682844 RepID=A0A6N8IS21_9BURK|nr:MULTISPECIES: outer membrane lipoprotein chaperone LolA [Ramlibacter]MBA2964689.1 outer membrane lipoprotein chaperone LolA [Ramlibacter sp. CGMCC 1.13660]MVQ29654.1 outer membrane lipoprotein chaperone LolA [Ramlibacter pinisoli]